MVRALALLISLALFLAACGGGGGGGAPAQPPINASDLVITTANAKPAVRVAYGATMESVDTGGLVGDSGLATTPGGGLQKPGAPASFTSKLNGFMQKDPLGPVTFDCGVAGTQTLSGEVASVLGLSVGDQINVDAMNCDDGFDEVINGRMEMTVTMFSGDLEGLYILEIRVVLIDFSVTTPTDMITSNGDATVMINTTGNPVISMSIGGTSLATVSSAVSMIMTNFDTAQTVDTSTFPEPYTLSSSGTVDSSDLSGLISFTTSVTFQGAGAGYPFAGQLVITGADGATITLTALDETTVRIETDTNNDGTPESTEVTTWEDIAG